MNQEKLDILKRALEREKLARKSAEKILEEKSRELYYSSQKIEKLLDEKSSQLQGVFENIIDAYVVIDIKGNVLKFNDAATKLFGYNIDVESLNVLNLIFKKDYDYAMISYLELQNKGFFKNYEARIYTKSKKVRWVHINASMVYDKNKNAIAAQGIVRDITDHKVSEKKLVESENRLSALIKNLDSGVLVEDENRNVLLTNKKFCELFNIELSAENLIGKNFTNISERKKEFFLQPEQFVKRVKDILENKKVVLGDQLLLSDGRIFERDYIPIFRNNNYAGHMSNYKDITDKVNYSRNLENQKQKYYNIIANMKLGLMEVDENDNILMVNQSFTDMSGYSEKELIGGIAGEIFKVDSSNPIFEEEKAKRKDGKSSSYELKVMDKHGNLKHWLISGAPNYNNNGEIVGSIGIHLDITEIKSLEIQKEKLLLKLEKSNEELQEYAHVVSHDLKSPLRSIDALVYWLKEDNKDKLDADSINNLNLIENTLEKMEQLITDVLNYSSVSISTTEKKPVDLNEIVPEIISLLYFPKNVEIKILKTLPIVMGDKTKIQQIFQNLISNAIKFSDKKDALIEIDFKTNPNFFEFSIKDNGIGIDKKYHDKIFKIFHTLNHSKDSTGIGLSIVKKAIHLHQGEIWLKSKPGEGSCFYFTFKK